MKIIFLDIDGVLNSVAYDRERTAADGNIDESRLALLRVLVERTDARIVLTSSWRVHWEDAVGRELAEVFEKNGLRLFDRTAPFEKDRAAAILAWLVRHPETEAYVILDDLKLGWGTLEPYVVKTDPRIGRGFNESHLRAAIHILNKTD